MILNVFLKISPDIGQIFTVVKALHYHLFGQTYRRLMAVGYPKDHTVASSVALLFEHGGGINIKQIHSVIGKSDKMKSRHSDAAGHLPFNGGELGPDIIRDIGFVDKPDQYMPP